MLAGDPSVQTDTSYSVVHVNWVGLIVTSLLIIVVAVLVVRWLRRRRG